MNTVIYKRTHTGDPEESGVFGIHDCMGRIRDWNYDAVIGVGGKRPWPGDEGIALKINWVGVNPDKKKFPPAKRGPRVSFDRFVLDNEKGKPLKTLGPKLFKYMFEDHPYIRHVMSESLPRGTQKEITKILKRARKPKRRRTFSSEIKFLNACVRKPGKSKC